MSIAPPQLKPSFKFLLNAQRPVVNNTSNSDSKPKICSSVTSNSIITPSSLLVMLKIAVFTSFCIMTHIYSPDKMPALLALTFYYETSSFTPDRDASCAAVLMLLMDPSENIFSWASTIIWPHMPSFVHPLCAALILCFPSLQPHSAITYAMALGRGLIYGAMKRKYAACEVVLFSPSITVLMFATCSLIILDNNKRITANLRWFIAGYSALQQSPNDTLSVIVDENSLSLSLDEASEVASKNNSTVKIQ
jgi:hypothetical protein